MCVCLCVCIVFLYAVASNVMFVMLSNTDQVYADLPKYDDDNANLTQMTCNLDIRIGFRSTPTINQH